MRGRPGRSPCWPGRPYSRPIRLLWRVFFSNAAVLTAAVLVLAISPATVSWPIGPLQAAVLAIGLAVMLIVDLLVLRRVFSPFEQLVSHMGSVDLLRPGRRVQFTGTDPGLREVTQAFNAMLERLETERRQAGQRLLSAQDDERRRVSRELHDEIGQLLTAALLELDGAARLPPEEIATALPSARATVDQALAEVRAVARRLRPLALDELGLAAGLAVLAATVARSSGIVVERTVPPDLPSLSPEAELTVYRVAQESLTNAVRHASPTRIDLSLDLWPDRLRLRVADDGCGYRGGENTGIRGMRERVTAVGGRLEIREVQAGGTEVAFELPVVTAR